MLEELRALLDFVPSNARRAEYAAAIVEANCLGKETQATRKLTNQRLSELYGLDPSIPLFRVLRRLWELDSTARSLLAVLAATARDPLLAATSQIIVPLHVGAELSREALKKYLLQYAGERLNESTIEKVCRNAASSWTQSGHLSGRTFKRRQSVLATPASAAYAIFLAHGAGFRGLEVFSSGWFQLLDCDPVRGRLLSLEAKRLGLIDLRISGDVVEFNLTRLDQVLH